MRDQVKGARKGGSPVDKWVLRDTLVSKKNIGNGMGQGTRYEKGETSENITAATEQVVYLCRKG